MPFKLKLKKTRQYNVASKSLFVISVELLDGGVADCTLSVDSTGQECLDNVCQRQAINQSDFFGLRYINRNQQPRWVQLERPLKRQLEKYATAHQLYLRVMYYVISGTSLITDEVTRYHYFLQLKNDLIEGRIICDCQQAVILASYSRQAEYGNHDRERHTVDYLKNLLTFPKQMLDGGQLIDGSTLAETGRLEYLTAAVIQHHMSLYNMPQAQAEEGFITTCQQLRGYGQEMYSARDQLNKDVTIAISLTGIRVLAHNTDTPHFYRWMDITNVINHKRTFSIECQKQSDSASFTLASPDDGKYVWRMCVHQHTFYMRHQATLSETPAAEEHTPRFQAVSQEHGLSESREELDGRESAALSTAHRALSTSCLDLEQPRSRPTLAPSDDRALLPSYRPAPDYETAIQQKYQQQRAEAQLRYQNHHAALLSSGKPLLYGSHPDIQRGHFPDITRHAPGTDDYVFGRSFLNSNYPPFAVNPNVQTDLKPLHYVNVYKPPPPYPSNGLASNSTPDLAVASQALNYHRGYINSHVSGSSPDLVSNRSALNRQYLGYVNTGSHNVINYGHANVMPGATHGTYNNIPSVLDTKPHIIIDSHHISDNIQKVYDERGNIMYSMPVHRLPYQRHLVLPQQQIGNLGETHEPIYENVPLPWRNEVGQVTMRDRAQSLTTTEELSRLNERYGSHPTINHRLENDNHYMNAQILKGVRETSVPKDLNISHHSVNKSESEFENIALSVDKLSLKDDKEYDETPYQSLSTHKVSNNNTINKIDNVTSISVPDVRLNENTSDMSQGSAADSAFSSSVMNSTYSTSIEVEGNGTKTSVTSKEKKRRRWGVFMGRAAKTDVKSATLGRDRGKVTQPANKHRWSTGLPKFQPLPPSITKETMCQILERKISDDQLAFAFEQIPKGRESGAEFRTALLPRHAALRPPPGDELPYEDNRVKLQPTPHNPHGYINASHITMTVGNTQRFYVLAKVGVGPGVGDAGVGAAALLWQCAWQVGAKLLLLVSGEERPHYLPQDHCTAQYGNMSVTHAGGSAAAWGESARIRVASAGRERALWHVHFAHWPRPPVPPSLHMFLEFLSEVVGLRQAEGGEAAPLVVCCAGGGRGGVALAALALLDIVDHNQELDIPRTIGMLNQQRANLVQNVQQYKFVHQLLLTYLKHSRLI